MTGLSGNVAEEAFCLKSAPASAAFGLGEALRQKKFGDGYLKNSPEAPTKVRTKIGHWVTATIKKHMRLLIIYVFKEKTASYFKPMYLPITYLSPD